MTPCTNPKLCGDFCTAKCQDNPTQLARGIAEEIYYGCGCCGSDSVKRVTEVIASALREYGEQRYNQGKIAGVEGVTSHIQSVTNASIEADAEGYRRGLEEGLERQQGAIYQKGESDGYRRGVEDSVKEIKSMQCGIVGVGDSVSSTVRNYVGHIAKCVEGLQRGPGGGE